MRTAVLVILTVSVGAIAGPVLSYHGTTPEWIVSGGLYKGTWFHLEDFYPGETEFTIEWAEVWLYSSVSTVYVSIWNGGEYGPSELLAQEELAGSVVWFSEPVLAGPDFWCILTSNDPAAVLADGDPEGHSYFSDDFSVWQQFDLGEFFISVGNETESLGSASWGTIKQTF